MPPAGRRDVRNRVLLLTDGQTWDDEDACLRLADEAGKEGIAITSIGLGEDWNEQLLLQLAERSRGNSHWIQNPIDILDAFRQEVEGLQAVAAVNLKATVRMSPGVTPVKVYATVPMISDLSRTAVKGQNVIADLGSLDGRKGQTLLIEARVPAQRAGKLRLGQVEITYDMPSRGITGESIRTDLVVTFTPDTAAAAKVNGRLTLRLSEAELLPFSLDRSAEVIGTRPCLPSVAMCRQGHASPSI